jgi:hypothetical protein
MFNQTPVPTINYFLLRKFSSPLQGQSNTLKQGGLLHPTPVVSTANPDLPIATDASASGPSTTNTRVALCALGAVLFLTGAYLFLSYQAQLREQNQHNNQCIEPFLM